MLLDYYDERNLVKEDLRVRWRVDYKIFGTWQHVMYITGSVLETFYEAWRHEIHTTCRYRYVGMDKETALQCQQDMIQYYTRRVYTTRWDEEHAEFVHTIGGEVLMSKIELYNMGGDMWGVLVDVDEVDELDTLYRGDPVDFSYVTNRQYQI